MNAHIGKEVKYNMKKRMLVLGAVMVFTLMTDTYQGIAKENVEEQDKAVSEESVIEIPEIPGMIMPLPVTIDMENLSDCMVAVSLDDKAVFTDEDGELQMKVKVWTYDLYDMIDISMLKEGSFIRIGEENVEVSSVETVDKGVLINGGLDNGGYELRTDEDTVYYEIGYSDLLSYYEVGETVLPVAEDFVFIDASDLDKGEVSYKIEDLQNSEEFIYDFQPNNTKIVIEEGKIIVMERVYTP